MPVPHPRPPQLIRGIALALLCGLCVGAAQAGELPATWAKRKPAKLQLASVQAVVADLDSGKILYAKNSNHVVPIASVTKLMTAMVTLDSGASPQAWLTIVARDKSAPNNAYSRIRLGSRLQRGTLLRLALMSSENLAAYQLAHHYRGGVRAFVAAMNAKACALGMDHSHFAGPTGLSPDTRSTAGDVLKMVLAAYRYKAIREDTQTGYYSARFRDPSYRLRYGNTDPLVHSKSWAVRLSKTGYLDKAGRCLAIVSVIGGRRVATVLLDSFGTRSPLGDVGRIRTWLTTGTIRSVAGPALAYERRKTAALHATKRGTNAMRSPTRQGCGQQQPAPDSGTSEPSGTGAQSNKP